MYQINYRKNAIHINKYIISDPEVCHGKPTIKRTRVMVWQVFGDVGGGILYNKEILDAFPSLTAADVKAALYIRV